MQPKIPQHKQREAEAHARETREWLEAGNEITNLPHHASCESVPKANPSEQAPSRKIGQQPQEALDALRRMGRSTYADIADALGCSAQQASKLMRNLERIELAAKTGEKDRRGNHGPWANVYRAR